GGSTAEVREALYGLMDQFGDRAKQAYRKKLSVLKEQNAGDFETQKSALLAELNEKLFKNELNKERCRRQAKHTSWRDSAPKEDAEEYVRANWIDYTGD
ncbi:MAG TPA: hypothetical protein DEF45_13730, partial [Rhodopirellula sp.]|nr:hypothetical protein [Rhodopirellula sp.]